MSQLEIKKKHKTHLFRYYLKNILKVTSKEDMFVNLPDGWSSFQGKGRSLFERASRVLHRTLGGKTRKLFGRKSKKVGYVVEFYTTLKRLI